MTREESLEKLSERARQLELLEGLRVCAILDALLAGASQREVASHARLSVNTVRSIMRDAGIKHVGMRYAVATTSESEGSE